MSVSYCRWLKSQTYTRKKKTAWSHLRIRLVIDLRRTSDTRMYRRGYGGLRGSKSFLDNMNKGGGSHEGLFKAPSQRHHCTDDRVFSFTVTHTPVCQIIFHSLKSVTCFVTLLRLCSNIKTFAPLLKLFCFCFFYAMCRGRSWSLRTRSWRTTWMNSGRRWRTGPLRTARPMNRKTATMFCSISSKQPMRNWIYAKRRFLC